MGCVVNGVFVVVDYSSSPTCLTGCRGIIIMFDMVVGDRTGGEQSEVHWETVGCSAQCSKR